MPPRRERRLIHRPVDIVITLKGALSLLSLPMAQYPEITPPSVQVAITYPGASAQVVADTVAAPIEQQVNGVEGMIYMSSQSGNDGSYTLTVTFEVGTDLNTALVMVQNRLVFLQNWRAALIPLVAVPVAILGTFAVMAALGFSLNNISLFGLVLAIGIVVDDAIVVVENVERWLEQGLAPREATRKAMDEVTGPIIAVALVLCAVFVPCAFIGGITGQFFRQFAVTIAVSTVFSALNSLTLSPALAAILLRPHPLAGASGLSPTTTQGGCGRS